MNEAQYALDTDESIEAAIDKYADMVFRLALVRTRNRHDADDVCQEVFLRLMNHIGKLENDNHLRAWLIRVTVNRGRTQIKSTRARETAELDEEMIDPNAAGVSEVYRTVLALPDKYRSAVHLHYYEGYSIEEISATLGQSASATKMQLSRARDMLKNELKGDF